MKYLAFLFALSTVVGISVGAAVEFGIHPPHPTTASAGPNPDTAYLTVLASKNVGVTSPADAVTMGHRVCAALTGEGVNRWLEGTRLVSIGYTGDEAATIVGASVASYCQNQAATYANQRGY